MKEQILIIKHGALGDIILATGPMKAIREQHPEAQIVVLTGKAFASLFSYCPFVNEVWVDEKPKAWQLQKMWRLRKLLRSRKFSWVYDLQTSQRSSEYFWLLPYPKPNWSGITPGASHRHDTAHRTSLHTLDREREQLEIAGIKKVPPPDISWMTSAIVPPAPSPFALLVPGGSAHRPEKRWPEARFISLCEMLAAQGIHPVLLGAGAEAHVLARIEAACVKQGIAAVNMCNKTSYADIAELARKAAFAVGNDTGPMHIIAAAGCRSVVLFSEASNPEMCAPRGQHISVLRKSLLETLQPNEITQALGLQQIP